MKCRNGDNDKDTYNDVDTKDEEYKDKPLNDYDKKANNKERPKENITFQYIIKNITDEINRYERKYKLVEFAHIDNSMELLGWRLMRYFLLTHLCGISHRIWCTLSTICSDAA